jgi:hypothetical protein
MRSPASVAPPNEPGYLLSLALIGLLSALLLAPFLAGLEFGESGRGTVLFGLHMMAWGCVFLASYYFSHKSFFLRALVWICEHMSHPRGRGMAFFYFLLGVGLGTAVLLSGLGIT